MTAFSSNPTNVSYQTSIEFESMEKILEVDIELGHNFRTREKLPISAISLQQRECRDKGNCTKSKTLLLASFLSIFLIATQSGSYMGTCAEHF